MTALNDDRDASAPPVILTLAGSDCSAGAGIQADLKAIAGTGGYAVTAVTCVVSEVPGYVSQIHHLDPSLVLDQIRVLWEAFPIAAIKTGVLGNAEMVYAIAEDLKIRMHRTRKEGKRIDLVIDPVLLASTGTVFADFRTIQAYREVLFPLATIVTPNIDELQLLVQPALKKGERLREIEEWTTWKEVEEAATEIVKQDGTAVVVTGGSGGDDQEVVADFLVWPAHEKNHKVSQNCNSHYISGPCVPGGSDVHGTGCAYSAAIASYLAQGQPLLKAVFDAKNYILESLMATYQWKDFALLPGAI